MEYKFSRVDLKPPISPRKFYRRFYCCYKGGQKHSHYLRSCLKNCCDQDEALLRIPKRIGKVLVNGDTTPVFWGLQAVEGISALRVVIYHALFLVGPTIFWALWLTTMGHRADLQNASVPFSAAVAFLSVFWFLKLNK
jgi:hypothetical protein